MSRPIDINQRIPLDTLYAALESYLNGTYSDEYVMEQLRLEFTGENRLRKSLRIVKKIILYSPLMDFIDQNTDQLQHAIKKKRDRNVILIALLNSSFSFAFDALQILGKFLSVQDVVNRETIRKSLSSIYGGNRSTENAIDSVIPMFLEGEFISRPGPGIYQIKSDMKGISEVALEIFKKSYHSDFPGGQEHLHGIKDPYFLFIQS